MKWGAIPLVLLLAVLTWGQDDVHIVPRVVPKKDSVEVIKSKEGIIRVKVDLALIPVIVQEHDTGKPYPFLQRGHFQLFYDKKPQTIRYFSTEDAPVSIGLIFDRSGSMGWKVDQAKALVHEFAAQLNQEDEIFVITFADTITENDFTSVQQDIDTSMLFVQSKGQTSLLDAVYLGMQKMKNAKYQRRALVVITDGGDNHSRYTEKEVKSVIEEGDTQFFAIALLDPNCMRVNARGDSCPREILQGPDLLFNMVKAGGGMGWVLDNDKDVQAAVVNIGLILRQEYLLGFNPTEKVASDGKYHKIKIKLQGLPKGTPFLEAFPKEGIYAPSE